MYSMLFGNNSGGGANALLDGAPFYLELTHTVVPTRGTGSPTFTRATTATFTDWEGVLRTVPSGCARFEGGRMIYNLIADLNAASRKSNDFTLWTASNATAVGNTVTFGAPAGAGSYIYTGGSLSSGNVAFRTFVASATVSCAAGTEAFQLGINDTGASTYVSGDFIATTTPQRVSFVKTLGGANAGVGMLITNSDAGGAKTIIVEDAQLEDVTGQADQTASEYVSVGVPSDWAGPEHVSNGTFDSTTTGWTAVNSTIVVENAELKLQNVGVVFGYAYQAIATVVGDKYVASCLARQSTAATLFYSIGTTPAGVDNGQASTTSTTSTLLQVSFTATATTTYLTTQNNNVNNGISYVDNISVKPALYHGAGVDGVEFFNTDRDGALLSPQPAYLAEGVRTNKALRSDDYNQAVWNVAGGNFVATDSGIASHIAGKNWQKIEVATSAATNISQAIGATGTTETLSVHLKKGNKATDANRLGIYNQSTASDLYYVSLNYDTGAVTELFGSGSYAIEVIGTGEYRLSVTVSSGISAGNNLLVYHGYSGNPGVAGDYFYAIGSQLEAGSFASTYIATTTAAVTRAADVLTYPSAGNIDGTVGWCYAEIVTNSQANHAFVGFDTSNQLMSQSNQRVSMYDGANQAVSTSTIMFGAQFKGAVTWGSDGVRATVNGEAPGSNASFDGNAVDGKANIYIGEWSDGSSSNFGTIRNVRIGQRQLSASEMQAITS